MQLEEVHLFHPLHLWTSLSVIVVLLFLYLTTLLMFLTTPRDHHCRRSPCTVPQLLLFALSIPRRSRTIWNFRRLNKAPAGEGR